MLLLIMLILLAAIAATTVGLEPLVTKKFKEWQLKKEARMEKQLDRMHEFSRARYYSQLYVIFPLVFAIAGMIIFKSPLAAIIGGVAGLLAPNLILGQRERMRRGKFQVQLTDAVNLISSCLRSGLSLVQAFDVLVEDMPAPISQEFGEVTKEVRIGRSVEEALRSLCARMPSEDLDLFANSIIIGRETGGDLPKVFSRLVATFRDRLKLRETIKTLTMQGRIQGVVMSFIPIFFAVFIYMNNKNHFDIMLQTQTGRFLLILAVVLQVFGMVLIHRFSQIKV